MTRRARDGELYCADGRIAGACVFLVRYGALESDKGQVLGLVYGSADGLYMRVVRWRLSASM